MNRRLEEIFAYLDATRAALLETSTKVNRTFASIHPQQGAWSVADIVAHLALVEAGIATLVARSVDWARTHGIGAELSEESVMSSLDQFRVVEPGAKRQASPAATPRDEKSVDESLTSLGASREQLKEALLAGADLDLSAVKRPHPALGEVNLYQWALFVGQHEERHRRQIERTILDATERAAESAPIV
jgi:hypothetical protein